MKISQPRIPETETEIGPLNEADPMNLRLLRYPELQSAVAKGKRMTEILNQTIDDHSQDLSPHTMCSILNSQIHHEADVEKPFKTDGTACRILQPNNGFNFAVWREDAMQSSDSSFERTRDKDAQRRREVHPFGDGH